MQIRIARLQVIFVTLFLTYDIVTPETEKKETLAQLKRNRAGHRGVVTKISKQVMPDDIHELNGTVETLNDLSNTLARLDEDIAEITPDGEYDQ